MIQLASGIQREIEGHFVLDEDGMRRIIGVLKEKAKTLPYKSEVVLAIRREDHRFYETLNIEDVLNDANTLAHRVQSLVIELRIVDSTYRLEPWDRNWVVQVAFKIEKKSNILINIHSGDRDWALLLADALEPQITRTLASEKIPSLTLLLLYGGVAAFLITCARTILPQLGIAKSIGDFLELATWVGTIVFLFATFDGERAEWLAKWVGPESSFKWGDQAASFQGRIERQKNIFWAVIVGFIVSIASTIYANVMLPNPIQGSEVKNTSKAPSLP